MLGTTSTQFIKSFLILTKSFPIHLFETTYILPDRSNSGCWKNFF